MFNKTTASMVASSAMALVATPAIELAPAVATPAAPAAKVAVDIVMRAGTASGAGGFSASRA